MVDEIKRTVAAFYRQIGRRDLEVYVRLQITRGSGPIGLDIALADRPEFVLLVQRNPSWSEAQARDGLHLSLATETRRNPADSLNPAWKTGNYLNNIMALREARARGADEVVMTNHAGEVTEAAVSNLGFVQGGGVVTPPLGAGILGGITRGLVLAEVARPGGVAGAGDDDSGRGLRPFRRVLSCCRRPRTYRRSPASMARPSGWRPIR
jgi:branched-subunit amino acid aminotransferase/4-amino-4-deoxychorismate lyase